MITIEITPDTLIAVNELLKVSADDFDKCATDPSSGNEYAHRILRARRLLGLPLDGVTAGEQFISHAVDSNLK